MRLLNLDPRVGHGVTVDLCAYLRVGSGVVEREHLLGQELRPSKGRGVSFSARNLAQITYTKGNERGLQSQRQDP